MKGAKTDADVRSRLLDGILDQTSGRLRLTDETKEALVNGGDAFDAFIAALVARAATLGLTEAAPPDLAVTLEQTVLS